MQKLFTSVAQILTVSVVMALANTAAAQQAYPSKPIRLIVPFPPGGGTNILARLVSQKLTERWGQQVIVDNRPGANSVIGSEALVKSPPDGYTIMLIASTVLIIPSVFPNRPFDIFKDFAPIAPTASTELVLALHPLVPANELQELIALAKSKPGQLNHASVATGTMPHLAIEFLNIMAGVKIQNIPYKGGGPALTDLLGGQVQMSFLSPIATIPYIRSGKLKAVAISGGTRLSGLPEVPTFSQAGLPGFDIGYWYGVFAPAGTSKAVINKLATEIAKIMAMPDTKEKLVGQGMQPFISTPEQFAARMKTDLAKYAKIIKAANIKLE